MKRFLILTFVLAAMAVSASEWVTLTVRRRKIDDYNATAHPQPRRKARDDAGKVENRHDLSAMVEEPRDFAAHLGKQSESNRRKDLDNPGRLQSVPCATCLKD